MKPFCALCKDYTHFTVQCPRLSLARASSLVPEHVRRFASAPSAPSASTTKKAGRPKTGKPPLTPAQKQAAYRERLKAKKLAAEQARFPLTKPR